MDNIRKKEAVLFKYDTTETTAGYKLKVEIFDTYDNEQWISIDEYINELLHEFKSENGYENEDNEAITDKRTELTEHYETLEKVMDKFYYLF